MMKKSYLIIAFILLFCSAIVLSEVQTLGTFKSDSCINLKQLGAGFDNCTLTTVQQPNSSVYIINSLMTKDDVEYNYTFCNTDSIGSYIANGFCSETGGGGDIAWNYNFIISQTGRDPINSIAVSIVTGIMLAVITFIFAYLATKVNQWYLQLGLSLLTFVMVIFDFFISARIIEAVDSAQTGIIYYLDTFFFIAVTLFRFLLGGVVIYLIYYMYKHIITNPLKKRNEEEGSIYE